MKQELIHKELSYRIIGLAFEIFNVIGPGHPEKYYQRAFEVLLRRESMQFKKQEYVPFDFKKNAIGKNFIDLIVEAEVIIELKVGERFTRSDFDQANRYLKYTGLKLCLLILFSKKGVLYKRVLNIYPR